MYNDVDALFNPRTSFLYESDNSSGFPSFGSDKQYGVDRHNNNNNNSVCGGVSIEGVSIEAATNSSTTTTTTTTTATATATSMTNVNNRLVVPPKTASSRLAYIHY